MIWKPRLGIDPRHSVDRRRKRCNCSKNRGRRDLLWRRFWQWNPPCRLSDCSFFRPSMDSSDRVADRHSARIRCGCLGSTFGVHTPIGEELSEEFLLRSPDGKTYCAGTAIERVLDRKGLTSCAWQDAAQRRPSKKAPTIGLVMQASTAAACAVRFSRQAVRVPRVCRASALSECG